MGITRALLTIVDSATQLMITMPVAAEKPPMKASNAIHSCFAAIGRRASIPVNDWLVENGIRKSFGRNSISQDGRWQDVKPEIPLIIDVRKD